MRELDLDNWNRKEHFEFYNQFEDPYFAVTVDFDVTNAFAYSKKNKRSFFIVYLFACMKAINMIENFKYRIRDQKVIIHDIIHASPTIARDDNTYGCSFIYFTDNFDQFDKNFKAEKKRVLSTTDLFPPEEGTDDCIYCSTIPWFNFSGHKEPVLGVRKESVPKLAFGKYSEKDERLVMPVAIAVNHALVDAYHVGLFAEAFQKILDNF